MTQEANELTPGYYALAALWSATAPTVVGEPAGALDEVRALGEFYQDARNEIQTLIGTATGGTFSLTYDGQTTSTPLDFDATAADIDTELELLSNIGVGDVTVTGGDLGTSDVLIEFTTLLAETDVAEIVVNDIDLTGGTVVISTTTGGYAGEIISDTFTDSDATPIDGRTPAPTDNGDTWTAHASWTIESNVAETDGNGLVTAVLDAGSPDVRVNCDVTWGFEFGLVGTRWNGLTLLGSGTSFLYFIPAGWDGTRTFKLLEDDGTVLATFHKTAETAVAGSLSNVEIDSAAGLLTFKVEGIEIGSYQLSTTEQVTYGSNTEFGMMSDAREVTPAGHHDNFSVTVLDDIDLSYLEAGELGIERYFGFRPFVPPAGSVIEFIQLKLRQSRTDSGLWRPRLGVVDAQGDIVWGPSLPAPVSIDKLGTWVERFSAEIPRALDGRDWDAFNAANFFLKLETVTEDDGSSGSGVFGLCRVSRATLRLRFNIAPTVTLDSIDVAGTNPVVAWTYADADGDPQDSFEVLVLDPAEISGNPDTPLEDLTALYDSGRIISSTGRTHRIDATLAGATLLTYAVRTYQTKVNGRDLVSEWDTADATTPTDSDATLSVSAVAGVGKVDLVIDDLGITNAVNIERSLDAGATFVLIVLERGITTDATRTAIDTFTRADGNLDGDTDEETVPNTWTGAVTSPVSSYDIASNGAEITPGSSLSVPEDCAVTMPLSADASVRVDVDVTRAPGGIRLRDGASGFIEARLTASTVELVGWNGAAEIGGFGSTVNHDEDGDVLTLELIAAGDEYAVLVNGRLMIREVDASIPGGIKSQTGCGISSAAVEGTSRFDNWFATDLDGSVEYTDNVAPQGIAVEYRATGVLTHVGADKPSTAGASSSPATITEGTWRLTDPLGGTSLDINPEGVLIKQRRPGDVSFPASGGVTASFGPLRARRFTLSVRTLNQTDFDTLETLLSLTTTLVLSDVFGQSYPVRHASDVDWTHVISEPEAAETFPVRHHHIARWTLQEVV